MDAKDPAGRSDDFLKELSHHARNVYYLIVAGSAAILLAHSVQTTRAIERAIDQLDALILVRDQWDDYWLDKLAEETLAEAQTRFPLWPAGLPEVVEISIPDGQVANVPAIRFLARRYERDWTFRGRGGYLLPGAQDDPMLRAHTAPLPVPRYDTVEQAQQLWDSLSRDPTMNLLVMPAEPVATVNTGAGAAARSVPVNITIGLAEPAEAILPAIQTMVPMETTVAMLVNRVQPPILPRGVLHEILQQGDPTISHAWFIGVDTKGRYANLSLPLPWPTTYCGSIFRCMRIECRFRRKGHSRTSWETR